jgi:hypothetical protein
VVQELRQFVRSQPANVDETGGWQKLAEAYLAVVLEAAIRLYLRELT